MWAVPPGTYYRTVYNFTIFINMIRLKTLLEQSFFAANNAPRFNLSKGSGGVSGKTPGTEFDDGTVDNSEPIHTTTSKDWVRETFEKAQALHRKADSTSYSIAKQLHKDIEGIGSGSLLKTLHICKDIEMLSSVIAAYIKLYKVSLYGDIEREWSMSWDSVWLAIKQLNPNVRKYISRNTFL